MIDDAPTPKVTGSHSIAQGIRAECDQLATALEAAALEGAREPGRPDLRMRRVAFRLRSVSRRVGMWHAQVPTFSGRKPERGPEGPTVSQEQRGQDHADAMLWLSEAQELLAPSR